MVIRRFLVVAFTLGALALTGCSPTAPPGTPTPPSSSARPGSAAPTSPHATTSRVVIPKDCRSLVSKADYGSVFGDTPLNDPAMLDGGTPTGHVTPSAPPPGATQAEVLRGATELICIWRDPAADITGLQVTVARVDPAVAKAYLAGLTAKGYTCGEAHSGLRCGLIKPNATYPVDEGYTSFLRDDIYIDVSQANFPTNDLIGKIVGTLWG